MDLSHLFDLVLDERRTHAARARGSGDEAAERFWTGVVRTVEAMRDDVSDRPRDVPEVWAYLRRALGRQGRAP